jgi:hypothetical protein
MTTAVTASVTGRNRRSRPLNPHNHVRVTTVTVVTAFRGMRETVSERQHVIRHICARPGIRSRAVYVSRTGYTGYQASSPLQNSPASQRELVVSGWPRLGGYRRLPGGYQPVTGSTRGERGEVISRSRPRLVALGDDGGRTKATAPAHPRRPRAGGRPRGALRRRGGAGHAAPAAGHRTTADSAPAVPALEPQDENR